MNPVYLHVGAHKTASSMLQSQLRLDREKLKNEINIVFREEMMKLPFYSSMKKVMENKTQEDVLSKEGVDAREAVLLTNEDMLSTLSLSGFFKNAEKGVEFLKKLFPGRVIKVILYIRCQVDYIESIYLQRLHMGELFGFEEFVKKSPIEKVSWLSVCEKISGIDGVDLKVIPYESIKSLGEDGYYREFLKSVGISNPESYFIDQDKVGGRKSNRSFSGKAIEIYSRLYDIMDSEEKKKLRVFLQSHFSTKDYPRPELFSSSQKTSLMSAYKDENKKMFEKFVSGYRDIANIYL